MPLKEQCHQSGFVDLNREIKQQAQLPKRSNKLRSYSFQNLDKSLLELLTKAKSFEDMKIYVDTVEKSDVHPAHTLRQTLHRSGKNGNLNRRRMSNESYFQCGGFFCHRVNSHLNLRFIKNLKK